MAVVLLQLKLAIQRRALGRGGGSQRAWFVAGWLLALVLGIAEGAVVDRLASARDGLGDLGLVLALSGMFLGWVLTPLLMPGLGDETVDPERLEQFPITPGDQVLGLLLGSLVAPTALFPFLVAAGGTFASGEDIAARGTVALAAGVFTVLCVAAGRSIGALVAGVMRSRRARDILVVVGGGAVFGAVHPRRIGLEPHRDRPEVKGPPPPSSLTTVIPRRPAAALTTTAPASPPRTHTRDQLAGVLVKLDPLDDRLLDPQKGTP